MPAISAPEAAGFELYFSDAAVNHIADAVQRARGWFGHGNIQFRPLPSFIWEKVMLPFVVLKLRAADVQSPEVWTLQSWPDSPSHVCTTRSVFLAPLTLLKKRCPRSCASSLRSWKPLLLTLRSQVNRAELYLPASFLHDVLRYFTRCTLQR